MESPWECRRRRNGCNLSGALVMGCIKCFILSFGVLVAVCVEKVLLLRRALHII